MSGFRSRGRVRCNWVWRCRLSIIASDHWLSTFPRDVREAIAHYFTHLSWYKFSREFEMIAVCNSETAGFHTIVDIDRGRNKRSIPSHRWCCAQIPGGRQTPDTVLSKWKRSSEYYRCKYNIGIYASELRQTVTYLAYSSGQRGWWQVLADHSLRTNQVLLKHFTMPRDCWVSFVTFCELMMRVFFHKRHHLLVTGLGLKLCVKTHSRSLPQFG